MIERFRLYFLRQVKDIQCRGTKELIRKFGVLLENCISPLIVISIRALSPIVIVRIGPLSSHSYGAYAQCTEVYLCEKDAGLYGKKIFDVFFNDTRGISNKQLQKMWARVLPMPKLNSLLDRVWRKLPKSHCIPFKPVDGDLDLNSLMPNTPPHISFSNQEEELGRERLAAMGVSKDTPFVCFHARDTAYTEAVMPEGDMRVESNYRNCSIDNYMPAINALADLGYPAFRMGSIVERPIPTTNPRVIDYTLSGRSDFMDVYLSANCKMFIGCTSGVFAVSQIFRRPMVLTNYASLYDVYYYGPNVIFIPKRLWSAEEDRFLTVSEIIQTDVSKLLHTQEFEDRGIQHRENTADEISAVVMEMEERLTGNWKSTPEDQQLQDRFWSLYPPRVFRGIPQVRIGAQFLRENQSLLV